RGVIARKFMVLNSHDTVCYPTFCARSIRTDPAGGNECAKRWASWQGTTKAAAKIKSPATQPFPICETASSTKRDCLTDPSPGPSDSARQISSTCSSKLLKAISFYLRKPAPNRPCPDVNFFLNPMKAAGSVFA